MFCKELKYYLEYKIERQGYSMLFSNGRVNRKICCEL